MAEKNENPSSRAKKWRAGLIGAGYLGGFHAEKLHQHPQVELTWISDLNEVRLKELQGKFGCQVTTDYKSLAKQVDFVVIASSTTTHYEIASFFAAQGLPIFLEKPIATSMAEARDLLAISEKNKSPIMIGHIERFNPVLIRARELAKLIEPVFVRCYRRGPFRERGSDVSVAHDLMIHDFDLLRHWTDCQSLDFDFAVKKSFRSQHIDHVLVGGRTDKGLQFELEATRLWPEVQRGVQVLGQKGSLDINSVTGLITKADFTSSEMNQEMVPKADAMNSELSSFVTEVLQNGRSPSVTAVDGAWALEQVEKVLRA